MTLVALTLALCGRRSRIAMYAAGATAYGVVAGEALLKDLKAHHLVIYLYHLSAGVKVIIKALPSPGAIRIGSVSAGISNAS